MLKFERANKLLLELFDDEHEKLDQALKVFKGSRFSTNRVYVYI